MGDQRVGVGLARTADRDRVAAGDVEMLVLLPLDPGIGLALDRQVVARRGSLRAGRRRGGEGKGEGKAKRVRAQHQRFAAGAFLAGFAAVFLAGDLFVATRRFAAGAATASAGFASASARAAAAAT